MTATLSTARLRLQPLRPSHAAGLHAAFGDPLAMAWWDSVAMPDLAATKAMIARQCAEASRGTHHYWTALWHSDASVVGAFDLSDIAPPTAEIGFIVAPYWWRRGLAREALTAVLAYGADVLGLTRFTARFHAGNGVSAALLAALGFGAPVPAGPILRAGEVRQCLVCERRA